MKKLNRIISLLLTAVMLFSVSTVAFAAEGNPQTCPVINIKGIDSSPVYADKNDTSTLISVPSKERIAEIFKEDIVPALLVYSAGQDAELLGKEICAVLNEEFKDWFNNSDGTAKGNSGSIVKYPASVKNNSRLNFEYDWRGDPVEIASELKAFIDYVTDKSGCEKVAVTCHSLGSIVLVSYFSLYGYDKVSGVVFDTPALMGLKSIGDALSGKVEFDGEALVYFLKGMLGDAEYAELIASISDIFELAGIPEMFSVFFDSILDKIGPTVYKETLIPLFGCWLTIWAMVPDGQIEESMEYVFDKLCRNEDYSALSARVENYNSKVRKNKKSVLLDFDKEGRVAVISRYGFAAAPVSESWSLLSDSVIETSSSSLGAVTAAAGDCFTEKYLEGKDMKYISPDRTIDASGCLFPEKTWFIKNARHSELQITGALYDVFLFSPQELTADTADFPSFMYYDEESGKLIKDVTEPEKAVKLSPLQRLFNFIRALLQSIGNYFRKLFG